MPDGRDRWPEAGWIASLLGTLFAAVAAQYLVAWALGIPVSAMNGAQLALTLGVRDVTALVVVMILAYRYLRISASGLGVCSPRLREALVAVAAVVVSYPLSVLVQRLFPPAHSVLTHAFYFSDAAGRVELVLIVGVFSPVVQEIIFRGMLLQGLSQRMPPAFAICAGALIFGISHASSGIGAVAGTFVFGLFAGGLFIAFRSLTGPIILHIAYNLGWAVWMLRWVHAL